jgi:hypothetical protein
VFPDVGNITGTYWLSDWVGPSSGLKAVGRRKVPCSPENLTPISRSSDPYRSHCNGVTSYVHICEFNHMLSPGIFLWVKGSRHVRLTTWLPSVSRLSRKCGCLEVSQPCEPPRPFTGIALPSNSAGDSSKTRSPSPKLSPASAGSNSSPASSQIYCFPFLFFYSSCLPNRCLAMIEGYTERRTGSHFIRHGQHWKRRVQQFPYCCVCIRCPGDVFTKPLPSNIHILTDWWKAFIKYAVEVDSGAMIYISSFVKICSGIQK